MEENTNFGAPAENRDPAPQDLTDSHDFAPQSAHDTAPFANESQTYKAKLGRTKGNPAAIILASIACVCSIAALVTSIYTYHKGTTPITFNSEQDGNAISFTEGSIAEVASRVSPAVVSIVVETKTKNSAMDYYSYLFGGGSQSQTSQAAGTGMIVTADGYVLTNKHVAEDATKITVVMDDGTSYDDVKLVGVDPLNDVAFIKINNVSNLPTVSLGNSKSLTVGQQVVAIGNALGQFQNTVTEGVISGTGRSITATADGYTAYETLSDMIQTDAAINSGNSGGPLINAAGEVIGINTAVSDSGNGLGFAIPISSVKGMLKSILSSGTASRAYIGVNYITLTPDVAKQFELNVTSGAYVYSKSGNPVISGSPAAKAGLKNGDIITAVNGVKVGQAGTVTSLIGEYAPGDTVQLTLLRDGQETSVNVTLDAYPSSTING
ncbi:trypsin-like peptidase domain-containing protein [Candidatus Saccharibacteria bacterium]|nr:trypsin-like peptidase domain-containing protein [Candidatus Saccharibacteria bacterium]